ncbi:unnamed protein product [Urochloa humidicola]
MKLRYLRTWMKEMESPAVKDESQSEDIKTTDSSARPLSICLAYLEKAKDKKARGIEELGVGATAAASYPSVGVLAARAWSLVSAAASAWPLQTPAICVLSTETLVIINWERQFWSSRAKEMEP